MDKTGRYAILVVGLCVTIWATSLWTNSFIKIHAMRIPYQVFLALFLLLGLVVSARWLSIALWKLVLAGALIGQIAGTLALTLSNLFIPNGLQRTARAIQSNGVGDVLISDVAFGFILGGWLVGVALFLCARVLDKREVTAATAVNNDRAS